MRGQGLQVRWRAADDGRAQGSEAIGDRCGDRRVSRLQFGQRAHHQHHRHDEEFGHQGQLRHVEGEAGNLDHAERGAQRLHLGDQHGGQIRSRYRAHAADHHDDKGVAQHREVEREIGRLARHLQRAAEARYAGAEREHGGEQQRLVDAERRHHLAILSRCADQPAEAGAGEHQIEAEEHRRPGQGEEDVVFRQPPPEQLDRSGQPRRAGTQNVLRPPDRQRRVVDHQQQREGGEQLVEFRRLVDAAQQHDLGDRPDQRHHQHRDNDAAPEAERAGPGPRDAGGEIDAEHVERAMGHVHDARHAEDDRQPRRHQEQPGRRGEPVHGLEQKGVERHSACPNGGQVFSWRRGAASSRPRRTAAR